MTTKALSVIKIVLLLALAAFTVMPLIFMLTASFMSGKEIMQMPYKWIPDGWRYVNFVTAIKGNDGNYIYVRNIINSFIVAISVSFTTVLLASITGYGLAKFKFRGRNLIFMLIMATMMIPFEAIMIPLYNEAAYSKYIHGADTALYGERLRYFYDASIPYHLSE